MRHTPLPGTHHFFSTHPLPCPYFPDRIERRVVIELLGRDSDILHDALTRAGYRRSHNIAYAPTCPECSACVTVRVPVDRFRLSKTQKRVMKRCENLTVEETAPRATEEQYALFFDYQKSRHPNGDMSTMDFEDYRSLIEETNVDTRVLEFREDEKLVAACLVDKVSNGYSAVYSFFDTGVDPRKSLGTFMILWLIEWARLAGIEYVYLGFWIENCRKMSYKKMFKPLEMYTPDGWRDLDDH